MAIKKISPDDIMHFTMVAENLGFSVDSPTKQDKQWYVEIQQYTPEGEDWYETVWFSAPNDIESEVERLYSNFDVDEEAELWIDSRGQNGVPSSIMAIVQDQQWKQNKLKELYEALHARTLDEESINRLIKLIKKKKFAFERYLECRLWHWHPLLVEPVHCSYGQCGWKISSRGISLLSYDYELEEISLG